MKKWLLVLLSVSAWPTIDAAEVEPKITKDIVLKAITCFREDPLSEKGRGFVAIVIRFAEKSPEVIVKITPKAVPFMKSKQLTEKERLSLLAAFVVGDVDSQLLRNQTKDDSYAGDLQLIETYHEVQKKNPRLRVPEIEKLIDLEKRGELKRYVTTP